MEGWEGSPSARGALSKATTMEPTPLQKIFGAQEVDHVEPIYSRGQYREGLGGEPIFFQYSVSHIKKIKHDQISAVFFPFQNSDFNFSEIGLVNKVKLKHKRVWSFRSGKKI